MSIVPLYHTGERRNRKISLPIRAVMWSRTELTRLTALYGQMVMTNQWRDYAIDAKVQGHKGYARFCVFRHAQERPFYIVEKHVQTQARPHYFLKNHCEHILTRNHDFVFLLRTLARRNMRVI